MAIITTHVLDTASGKPASGMHVQVRRVDAVAHGEVLSFWTDMDGRTEEPLVHDGALATGKFEILFHVGEYFEQVGAEIANAFLEIVPVRFTISEDKHYHVPLLVSPYSYSTYRGS